MCVCVCCMGFAFLILSVTVETVKLTKSKSASLYAAQWDGTSRSSLVYIVDVQFCFLSAQAD